MYKVLYKKKIIKRNYRRFFFLLFPVDQNSKHFLNKGNWVQTGYCNLTTDRLLSLCLPLHCLPEAREDGPTRPYRAGSCGVSEKVRLTAQAVPWSEPASTAACVTARTKAYVREQHSSLCLWSCTQLYRWSLPPLAPLLDAETKLPSHPIPSRSGLNSTMVPSLVIKLRRFCELWFSAGPGSRQGWLVKAASLFAFRYCTARFHRVQDSEDWKTQTLPCNTELNQTSCPSVFY